MKIEGVKGTAIGSNIDKSQLGDPPVDVRVDSKTGTVWIDNFPNRTVGRRSRYISAIEHVISTLSSLYEQLFKAHQKTLRALDTANGKLEEFGNSKEQDNTTAARATEHIRHLEQELRNTKGALEEVQEQHRLANQARDEKDEQTAKAVQDNIAAIEDAYEAEREEVLLFILGTLKDLDEAGILYQELDQAYRKNLRQKQFFADSAQLSQTLVAFLLRIFTIKPIEDARFAPRLDEELPEVLVVVLLDIGLQYTLDNPPSLVAYSLEDAEEQFLNQKLELGKDGLPTMAALLFLEFLTELATTAGKQKHDDQVSRNPALYQQLFGNPSQSDDEEPSSPENIPVGNLTLPEDPTDNE